MAILGLGIDVVAISRFEESLERSPGFLERVFTPAERDRSTADEFDLKQGVGGLVDLEFLLQGLVLRHAAEVPALIASGNSVELVDALRVAGLVDDETAAQLVRAHAALLARAIRCTLDARPRVAARDDDLQRAAADVVDACRACGFAFD